TWIRLAPAVFRFRYSSINGTERTEPRLLPTSACSLRDWLWLAPEAQNNMASAAAMSVINVIVIDLPRDGIRRSPGQLQRPSGNRPEVWRPHRSRRAGHSSSSAVKLTDVPTSPGQQCEPLTARCRGAKTQRTPCRANSLQR